MKILVVIDMQNDFITGSLGTPEALAIVPNVKKKVREYIDNNDYIFYTRDTHCPTYLKSREGKKLPVEHCVYKTEGWQIPEELLPPFTYEKASIIDKPTFGSMKLVNDIKGLWEYEPGNTEIELVGLCTGICVASNALLLKAACYEDAEISVDATCCACVTPETHEAALKTMEMCQINVKR